MLMMAFSNKTGSILLATGYSTLYGAIGDLLKIEV